MTDTPQDKALKEARDRFAAFPKHTSDMTDMVDFHAQQIIAKLKEAGVGAAALGFPSDAAGEAEIEKRRLNCALRSARKMYRDALSDSTPHEISIVTFHSKQIERMAKHAGVTLAALDENGNSLDRDVAERLENAGKAVLRLTARKLFREFIGNDRGSFADQLDYHVEFMTQHVAAAGFGWRDLDPAFTADADAHEKIAEASRRIYLLGARKAFEEFRVTPSAWGEHMIEYHLKKITGFLEKAGVDAAALDDTGNSTAGDMEREIEGAAERARFLDLLKPFEEDKKIPATLKELWGKLGPLKTQFEKAQEYFDAADPAIADLGKRFDAASRKARDHACEQEGVVPVLKTLKLKPAENS